MRGNKRKIVLFFPKINPLEGFHWFPFSVLALGATLKRFGYEPVIIDERIEPNYEHFLGQVLNEALCVGITAMTGYQIEGGIRASEAVRAFSADLPIIWGGRHATLMPEQTVEDPMVDVVVKGQGENTLVDLANAISTGSPLHDVDGICFKNSHGIISTTNRPLTEVCDLDGFDWSLINIAKYINPDSMAVAYFSSFGCPARCGFCANSWSEKKWMSLDPIFVLDDLGHLIGSYGFKNVIFQDSNFFVSKRRVRALADGFIDRGFHVKWKASIRADQFCRYEDARLRQLEDSGLSSLFIGLESGSQRVLDGMQKDTTLDDAIKTVVRSADYGFEVHASLMFGLPGETLDDLKATIDHVCLLRSLNPKVKFQTCFYSPFPNTPLYEKAVANGYMPPKNLREWAGVREQREVVKPVWFEEKLWAKYEELFRKYFMNSATTEFKS